MSKKSSSRNFLLPIIVTAVVLTAGVYVYHQQTSPTVLGTSNNAAIVNTKEYFVPLGYGAFANSPADWTDVSGVQVTMDTWQYPRIKQASLETTVYSPNGNQTVWVRLRNYDGWSYPEISMDGAGPRLLTTTLTLSPGPKTYYLQVKTQLGYPVQIYQARLHITTY